MLPKTHVKSDHSSIWYDAQRHCDTLAMHQDRIPRITLFNTAPCPIMHEREDWSSGKAREFLTGKVTFFTDGSLMDGRAGAGVHCQELGISASLSLGKYASVFQSEVLAIREAVEVCLLRDMAGKDVVICSDSKAALMALAQPEVKSALVRDCKLACRRLREKTALSTMWVPGHSDIQENEEADRLAREGSSQLPCAAEPILGVSTATTLANIAKTYQKKFEMHWKRCTGAAVSKEMMETPSMKRTQEIMRMDRRKVRAVTSLLTGHGPFRYTT